MYLKVLAVREFLLQIDYEHKCLQSWTVGVKNDIHYRPATQFRPQSSSAAKSATRPDGACRDAQETTHRTRSSRRLVERQCRRSVVAVGWGGGGSKPNGNDVPPPVLFPSVTRGCGPVPAALPACLSSFIHLRSGLSTPSPFLPPAPRWWCLRRCEGSRRHGVAVHGRPRLGTMGVLVLFCTLLVFSLFFL